MQAGGPGCLSSDIAFAAKRYDAGAAAVLRISVGCLHWAVLEEMKVAFSIDAAGYTDLACVHGPGPS